jgi:hypothetical protein
MAQDFFGSVAFAEHAARARASYYRDQAAHLRTLVEVEPLPAMRRRLMALVRDYEELAAGAEVAKT